MDTVFVVNSDSMGSGDVSLGTKLLGNLLKTLVGLETKPGAIVFYNGGVRLLAKDSASLEALQALHGAGVELLACVTCLEFFHLIDNLGVGRVSNMREIATQLMRASKVVTV